MSKTSTITNSNAHISVGSIALRASTSPLKRNNALDAFDHVEVTPHIGEEFDKTVQLSELLKGPEWERFIKDLAILGAYDPH